MTEFTSHTEESAPEASNALLADSRKAYGMMPGLHAIMAEAPGLLEAYKTAHELVVNSSFDEDEITVLWQTANTWSVIDSDAA